MTDKAFTGHGDREIRLGAFTDGDGAQVMIRTFSANGASAGIIVLPASEAFELGIAIIRASIRQETAEP